MGMQNPIPQFSHIVASLRDSHPTLAYIHLVEPRVDGWADRREGVPSGQSNDFIRQIWAPRPLITAGGYTLEMAVETAEKKGDLIAFGRAFIANVSSNIHSLVGRLY